MLFCVVCGCSSGDEVEGWTAVCCNDPEPGEAPDIAFYCPPCATAEFKHPPETRVGVATRSARYCARMELAGIAVDRLAVLELAERLTRAGYMDTAALLLIADASGDDRVGFSIKDREAVLDVLDDPPAGLCELRGALISERVGRVRGQIA